MTLSKPLNEQAPVILCGSLMRRQRTVKGFTRKYTPEDIRLLAHADELHSTLSGPATKKFCERA